MAYNGQARIAFETGFNDALFGRPNANPYDQAVVGESYQAYEEGYAQGLISDTPPRGPKGDTGDTGATGATGATGPAGADGAGTPVVVEDEGILLTSQVALFDFVGAGVTATEPIADQITVTIPGGASSLAGLSDVDLTGQVTNSMLFNVDGTNWEDTGTQLQWDQQTFYINRTAAGLRAVEIDAGADSDSGAYMAAYSGESSQYIEMAAFGTTQGVGNKPHAIYFASSADSFEIQGDNGTFISFEDITAAPNIRLFGNYLMPLVDGGANFLVRTDGAGQWEYVDPAAVGVTDHTLLTNIGTNTHAQIDTHIADGTIHFTEGSIDHTAITNIGTNSHAQIDTHIADATIHFTEASIDHTAIANIGTNSHATIDTHIADATIHFTEGSIDHTAISNIGTNTHAQIDTHIADATIHFTEGSIDHTAITNIGTNSHAAIDTHIADATIHFTEGSIDHGNLVGLADDDHINYFFALGRAGGQSMFGGTAAADDLEFEANTIGGAGRIRMATAVEWANIDTTTALYPIIYAPTESFGVFIGGGINISPTIGFTGATFIWEGMRAGPIIQSNVVPGFAAFTLFNALPVLRSGSVATYNPLQSLCLNAGVTIEHDFSGARSTINNVAVSAALQTRAGLSGGTLSMTTVAGLTFSPTFSTVSGATVNLGTCYGLRCSAPAAALFQPQAGVENITAYYGVDVLANTFGGASRVQAALRSALAANTNVRFLSNTGGAESDFGNGDIHLNDGTWVKYGNTLASPDMGMAWASAESALSWTTFWGVGGNPLYLEGTAADEWIFRHHSGGTLDIGVGFDVNAIVFGTTAPTPNSNNWFVQFAAPNQRQVQIGGEYSDVLWTAGGSIDVNGLAVSDLQAFKINSPAVILNGGSISDISNLFVQAMPSFGATRTQALRVLGRGRIDGHLNQGSQSPAQLTANTNDWQLAANNGQRGVVLLDSDGAYNITGIDASFGFAQTGDFLLIINLSAFTMTFTHQDAASTAAYRIITATGAGIAVASGESIKLWYDDTGTLRWYHIREN